MRASLIALSLIFSLSACGPALKDRPYVIPPGSERMFNVELGFFGSSVNGFLAVRHAEPGRYRFNISSLSGSSMLEVEWRGHRWVRHHASRIMQKPFVVAQLKRDLFLIYLGFGHARGTRLKQRTYHRNGHRFLVQRSSDGHITEVTEQAWTGRPLRRVVYTFDGNGITNMEMRDLRFPLRINVSPIAE
jgi:hypothetical protein